ncbi:MAG TPA: CcoQ/FixQ family Cbb3-type cytochrome c oxidase assembly chaperone [Steroidobacteraceae bacterium]|nr:CcoQ/FixQ family Cbb3-type cytochrome c oxidase assembly chaperone [Steroidobacteraceae bacterium]
MDTFFSMGTFRGVVTAVLLGLFVGLVIWAWSRARKPAFDAAARLPLEEDAHD